MMNAQRHENENDAKMTRQEAGRMGGQAVSRNRDHMAQIGRKGGEAVSQNRAHMAEIGRKGGQSSGGRTGRTRANEGEPVGSPAGRSRPS